jgi:hypothetical protein
MASCSRMSASGPRGLRWGDGRGPPRSRQPACSSDSTRFRYGCRCASRRPAGVRVVPSAGARKQLGVRDHPARDRTLASRPRCVTEAKASAIRADYHAGKPTRAPSGTQHSLHAIAGDDSGRAEGRVVGGAMPREPGERALRATPDPLLRTTSVENKTAGGSGSVRPRRNASIVQREQLVVQRRRITLAAASRSTPSASPPRTCLRHRDMRDEPTRLERRRPDPSPLRVGKRRQCRRAVPDYVPRAQASIRPVQALRAWSRHCPPQSRAEKRASSPPPDGERKLGRPRPS